MTTPDQHNPQAVLSELVECQRVLEDIKEDLDLLSDGLEETPENLTKMRAFRNTLNGIHYVGRTFPGCKRRAA